jgi:taurine dioxygenase/putative 2-oxoglutarate oxygenase
MLTLKPLTDRIGVEACGVDVTQSISARDFDRMYEAWIDATILLIRGPVMDPVQQAAFTQRFGEVVSYTRRAFSNGESPVLILSNIVVDGKVIGSPVSGRVWHTDGHYLANPPSGSLLHALETPPVGGDTFFANMFAAYDDLPESTKKQIADRRVVISRLQSRPYNYPDRAPPTEQERAEWIDMPQPMVLTHPENGRKALYVGGNVPWHIVDMDETESAPLVTFVQEFSIMPKYTYRHKWSPGDIIVWDNRSAMHRATPYDQVNHRRRMHRTTFISRGARGAAS